jgi:hypothetical protein
LGIAEIVFERCFQLRQYAAPQLIPMLMAKIFSEDNDPRSSGLRVDRMETLYDGDDAFVALGIANACWKNVIKQQHYAEGRFSVPYTIWIVLESCVLRLIGVGEVFCMNIILEKMEVYATYVREMLNSLPGGLRNVQETITCPQCLAVERWHRGKFEVKPIKDLADQVEKYGAPHPALACRTCRSCGQQVPLNYLAYVPSRFTKPLSALHCTGV